MSTTHEPGGPETNSAPPEPAPAGVGHAIFVFAKEVVIIVGLAIVLSLVLKTWFVQSFYIPSASMNNTLVQDDRVIVSKLTPGPFDLGRGDIVVFEDPGGWLRPHVPPEQGPVAQKINGALTWVGLLPSDEGNHLIKRVIGLPGDRVSCAGGGAPLEVNGTPINEPYLYPGNHASDKPFDIVVPAGRVWVMGDHRSDSQDSRYQDAPGGDGSNGSVPIDRVVGRAFAIVWPLGHLAWLGEPSGTFDNVPAPSLGVTPQPRPTATSNGGAQPLPATPTP